MGNIQTRLRQTVLLKVSFVENSLDLIILIKLTITCRLTAILQREETYSLKLKHLSITIPNNFLFELFQILALPTCVQIFLCLYPESNGWLLSWFSFMKLLSNHSIIKWQSWSNLLIKVFKSLSQAKKVVPSNVSGFS